MLPTSKALRRRAKRAHKIEKNEEISYFVRFAGYSLLRAEGFSCSLDVLYEGLGRSN
jgi:hypothetical protein